MMLSYQAAVCWVNKKSGETICTPALRRKIWTKPGIQWENVLLIFLDYFFLD